MKGKTTGPRACGTGVDHRVPQHPETPRGVRRFFKPLREFQGQHNGGPSSVAIMIAACQSFEPAWHRDDVALEKSAGALSRSLAGDIREGGIDNRVEDFNRLDPEARRAASQKAAEFARQLGLARALSPTQKVEAIQKVRTHLGPRISSDLNFVEPESGADVVRVVTGSMVAPPVVGSSQAS